jgi:hypothetical protein
MGPLSGLCPSLLATQIFDLWQTPLRPRARALSLSLSLAMNSPSDNGSSRAHFQSRDLMRLHEFGLQRVPLYNPHRTR